MIPWEFLPFNLRWVRQLTWETTEGDCESSPLLFPDETTGIDLIFRISLQEFTKVLSALEKGATLSYPSEDWDVVWFFLRNFECPMSICEQIINCVANDPDTQQAIANMLMDNLSFNTFLNERVETLTTGQISTKLIAGDCDRPSLAGKIKALVDAMDTANRDWFEKIEEGTNSEEKFALVVGAIPGLETLPIDEVVNFAQDIFEDLAEGYASEVDTTLLEEWYCGLLCVAENNPDCSITYGEVYDYFAKRVGSNLNPFSTLADVVNFVTTGEFAGASPIADAVMALQTGLMVNGRSYFGSSLPTIAFAMRDAPTSSFYEDCDECPDDDFWLLPVLGNPDTIEFVEGDATSQTYILHNYGTGNYLTGGAVSASGTPLYITNVEYVPSETGPDARFVTDYGYITLNMYDCARATAKMWLYNVFPDVDVTITVSKEGCFDPIFDCNAGLPPEYCDIISQSQTSVVFRTIYTDGAFSYGGVQTALDSEGDPKPFMITSINYLNGTPEADWSNWYDGEGGSHEGLPSNGDVITAIKVAGPMGVNITVSISGYLI